MSLYSALPEKLFAGKLPRMAFFRSGLVALMLGGLCLAVFGSAEGARADSFATPAFEKYWSRADFPVITQTVQRGYTWGPTPFFTTYEPYQESPNQRRLVQYFDKTRMEINRPAPDGNPESPFYVTNGLLTKELVTGAVQTGDNQFQSRTPAFDLPVAGDPVEYNPDAPTYASFFNLLAYLLPNSDRIGLYSTPCTGGGATSGGGLACQSPIRINEPVVDVLNKDGSLSRSLGLGTFPGVRYVYYDRTLKHNVPQVFWDYLNQKNIVFDTSSNNFVTGPIFDWIATFGYPITDAYWVSTRVAGALKNVMVQVFERRILTFTPGNPLGFEVEMGNVGQHYFKWRYNAKYDISVPLCAFCTITPQIGYPGTTFRIRTEPIFLSLNGINEPVTYTVIAPNGKTLLNTNTDASGLTFTADGTDLGRVRLAITTTTTTPRGLYTVIMTGNTSTQQAKAFFYVIDVPGVRLDLANSA